MIFLLALLATLHLIAVTVGAAGPLVNITYEWMESPREDVRYRLNNRLLRLAIVAWVAGGALGVLLGFLAWNDSLAGSLNRLSSKVHYGVIEYFFTLLLMVGYLVWRNRCPAPGRVHRAVRCVVPLAAGSNSIYHFPVLFAVLSELQRRGLFDGDPISAAEFRQQWLVQSMVWAKSIHVVIAGLAFCGLTLLMVSVRAGRATDEPLQRTAALAGARLALLAVVCQVLSGFWLVTTLDSGQQKVLLGGDLLTTSIFAGGVLLAYLWMHLLGQGIVTPLDRRRIGQIAVVGTACMLLMVTAAKRERLLTSRIAPDAAPVAQTID